jgi:hypothetical protein
VCVCARACVRLCVFVYDFLLSLMANMNASDIPDIPELFSSISINLPEK